MGAVTIANARKGVYNAQRVVEADVTFNASYVDGGDSLPLSSLGLRRVDEVLIPSHDLITRKPVTTIGAAMIRTRLGGTSTAPTLKAYGQDGNEFPATTATSTLGPLRLRFIGI